MDMSTTVWLVRTLMLVGMTLPLVIGGVVVAIRDRHRDSKASGDASTSPGREPAFVSRIHRDSTNREVGERMTPKPPHRGWSGARLDVIRGRPGNDRCQSSSKWTA